MSIYTYICSLTEKKTKRGTKNVADFAFLAIDFATLRVE